jgi:hypothetical protein
MVIKKWIEINEEGMKEETDGFSLGKSEEDETIQAIINLVSYSLERETKKEEESFEIYADKLKSHIHKNRPEFYGRLVKGYHFLIEILRHLEENK